MRTPKLHNPKRVNAMPKETENPFNKSIIVIKENTTAKKRNITL